MAAHEAAGLPLSQVLALAWLCTYAVYWYIVFSSRPPSTCAWDWTRLGCSPSDECEVRLAGMAPLCMVAEDVESEAMPRTLPTGHPRVNLDAGLCDAALEAAKEGAGRISWEIHGRISLAIILICLLVKQLLLSVRARLKKS
eukprot:4772791-Pleurochrysis_carterae.AAC.2